MRFKNFTKALSLTGIQLLIIALGLSFANADSTRPRRPPPPPRHNQEPSQPEEISPFPDHEYVVPGHVCIQFVPDPRWGNRRYRELMTERPSDLENYHFLQSLLCCNELGISLRRRGMRSLEFTRVNVTPTNALRLSRAHISELLERCERLSQNLLRPLEANPAPAPANNGAGASDAGTPP